MKWVKVDENICGATHISASASYGSNQKRFEQLNAMNAVIPAHKLEVGSRKVQCEKSDVQCLQKKIPQIIIALFCPTFGGVLLQLVCSKRGCNFQIKLIKLGEQLVLQLKDNQGNHACLSFVPQ